MKLPSKMFVVGVVSSMFGLLPFASASAAALASPTSSPLSVPAIATKRVIESLSAPATDFVEVIQQIHSGIIMLAGIGACIYFAIVICKYFMIGKDPVKKAKALKGILVAIIAVLVAIIALLVSFIGFDQLEKDIQDTTINYIEVGGGGVASGGNITSNATVGGGGKASAGKPLSQPLSKSIAK